MNIIPPEEQDLPDPEQNEEEGDLVFEEDDNGELDLDEEDDE